MISENKIKHSLAVARKCREIALHQNSDTEFADAMFVMGLLHDIGYEFEPDSNHGHRSVEMIEAFIKHLDGCKDAIACHGLCFDNWSNYDEILNQADMSTSYDGTPTTIDKRLEGIREIWGENSIHYKHAIEVSNKLKTLAKKENAND